MKVSKQLLAMSILIVVVSLIAAQCGTVTPVAQESSSASSSAPSSSAVAESSSSQAVSSVSSSSNSAPASVESSSSPATSSVASSSSSASVEASSSSSQVSSSVSSSVASSPAPAASALKGEVTLDGSSTVFLVSQAVAEEFQNLNPDVKVTVGVKGTGGGFKRFCNNETDISDASRPIKQEEIDACKAAKVEYVELPFAYDGVSIVTNPKNDFVDCLKTTELQMLWAPDSKIQTWKDIRPEWPAEKITLYGPTTDNGTFDFFTEKIVGKSGSSRTDYTPSTTPNVLVEGISGDKNALGYFGFAYYEENQDKLKLLGIDNGKGCVKPDAKTILSGDYAPLSRPIFIYPKLASLKRPEVKAFVEYYLSDDALSLIPTVGYVNMKAADIEATRAKFQAAVK
jgi:phosphate transport system substrate-binding protein